MLMKKVISVLLSLAIVFGLAAPVFGAATGEVTLNVSSASGVRGDILEITVDVSAHSNMQACDFDFLYDHNVLEVVSAQKGSVTGSPIINKNLVGRIVYSYASTNAITSAETLLKISFKVKDNAPYGKSEVSLNVKDVSDGDFNSLNHTVNNGLVTVQAPKLDAPYNVVVSAVTSSTAECFWEAIEGASGYNIYLNGQLYNNEPILVNYCILEELTSATDYDVQIATVNYTVESDRSETVAFRTEEKKLVCLFRFPVYADGEIIDYTKVYREVACGENITAPEAVDIEGHVFIGWDNSLENITVATMFTAQYEKIDCSHLNTETQGAVASTCTTQGYSGDVVCTDCGTTVSYGTQLELAKHDYEAVITPATPETQGFTTHTCKVCGDSYKDNYVDYVEETLPVICVEHKESEAGQTVDVAIALINNPGIVSATLRVSYDAALSLQKVTDAGILGTASHKPIMVNPYTLTWNNDPATENNTANGTVVTLTFNVAEGTAAGEYPISVSYEYDNYDIYNANAEKVRFSVVNGGVKVVEAEAEDPNCNSVEDFTYTVSGTEMTITGYVGTAVEVVIGERYKVDGTVYTVTEIAMEAFLDQREITCVTLPETVSFIGEAAFYDCVSLTQITVLNPEAQIGEVAFGYYYASRREHIVEGFTLYGYPGSTAEAYAAAVEEITWVSLVHVHTEVIDEAVNPTCTEAGLTEGKHCESCGEVLVAQEPVAALGHSWGDGIYTDPTTKEDGYTTYTCGTCGEKKTEIDEGTRLPSVSAITEQPKSVSVDTGETVQFTVVAEGDVVSYRWEYRKIYKWFNTYMDGCNTDTLTVAATGYRNGYDYRCVVTFADGTVLTSEPAELTVKTYLNITYHPNDQTVVLGYRGQFTAKASGEGIAFQWQYQRPNSETWNDTKMEGCNQATVMIETTKARDGYKYRCKITDVTGNVAYTDVATMRVLTFTKQPVSVMTDINKTVQFTVSTSVSDGFDYQWEYRRSATAAWTNTSMTGCNTNTLTVVATANRNGYQYRCKLIGSKNSTLYSNEVTLNAGGNVQIKANPENREASLNSLARFTVEAENVLSYQWFYSKNGTSWYSTSADGATTKTLSIRATLNRSGYQYRCKMTALNGTVTTSEAATLTVSAIEITAQPVDRTAGAGQLAAFAVRVAGVGNTYRWQFRKSTKENWYGTSATGYDTNTMYVESTEARNGYQYRCKITDSNGNVFYSDPATLIFSEEEVTDIQFAAQPIDRAVTSGKTVQFSAVTDYAKATYRWQYRRDDTDVWHDTSMEGYNTETLSVEATDTRNGYQYRCVITAGSKQVISEIATLTVE